MTPPVGRPLRIRWLGRLDYGEAWDLQKAFWEGRVSGRSGDDRLLLLEHPHVYTVGRNGDGSNLLAGPDRLVELGATVEFVDRGGDITYHGPGQLVGYPIFAVPRLGDGFDMVGHVRRLEQVLLATLRRFGIEAWIEDGFTGVWTDRGKVAAIGVRVARGVSMHGFALNVDPDLAVLRAHRPLRDRRPTRHLDGGAARRPITLEEVVRALVDEVAPVFGHDTVETQLGAFSRGAHRTPYDVDRMVADGVFSPERRHEVPLVIGKRLVGEPARPEWMRVKADVTSEGYRDLKTLMRDLGLNTVCEEAGCPNIYECWGQGTATLMLLGDRCTRACAFCNVATGRPGRRRPRRAEEGGRGHREDGPAARRAHLGQPRRPRRRWGGHLRRDHRTHPRPAARLLGRGAHPRLQG